jgi:hypothetical protein
MAGVAKSSVPCFDRFPSAVMKIHSGRLQGPERGDIADVLRSDLNYRVSSSGSDPRRTEDDNLTDELHISAETMEFDDRTRADEAPTPGSRGNDTDRHAQRTAPSPSDANVAFDALVAAVAKLSPESEPARDDEELLQNVESAHEPGLVQAPVSERKSGDGPTQLSPHGVAGPTTSLDQLFAAIMSGSENASANAVEDSDAALAQDGDETGLDAIIRSDEALDFETRTDSPSLHPPISLGASAATERRLPEARFVFEPKTDDAECAQSGDLLARATPYAPVESTSIEQLNDQLPPAQSERAPHSARFSPARAENSSEGKGDGVVGRRRRLARLSTLIVILAVLGCVALFAVQVSHKDNIAPRSDDTGLAVAQIDAATPRFVDAQLSKKAPTGVEEALKEERRKSELLGADVASARGELEALKAELARSSSALAAATQSAHANAQGPSAELVRAREQSKLLESDLGSARREIEALKTELARSSSDGAATTQALKKAQEISEELARERERAKLLTTELASARDEIETRKAELTRSSGTVSAATQALKTRAQELSDELGRERDRSKLLSADLTSTRGEADSLRAELERHSSALTAATRDTQAMADELGRERERSKLLEAHLASSRGEAEGSKSELARSAAALSAATQASQTRVQALTDELGRERERSKLLEAHLASTRGEAEASKSELARSASALSAATQASQTKVQALTDELGRERERSKLLEAHLASARGEADASKFELTQSAGALAEPAQTAVPARNSNSQVEEKLLLRARNLIQQGDISAARMVLNRAIEEGSSMATFILAETYDSRQLRAIGVRGIPGDPERAQLLYAKAYANGIVQAKERITAAR